MELSSEQLAHWQRDGWLVLRQVLDASQQAQLQRWVGEVEVWARDQGPGLHHFEQTDHGPAIARSEDLVPNHKGIEQFICHGLLAEILEQLLGEPGVIFKEKINYKQPGGGGFAYHQDATAYRFVDHHVSVMVPLDPATAASGCLLVAPGYQQGAMPTDERGRIQEWFADTLDWRPVEVLPGDLLWFDSYTPHHSETNATDHPRRAFYLTYNALSLGDHRGDYYADKRAEFDAEGHSFGGERVRISISDDFLGRPVPAAPDPSADD